MSKTSLDEAQIIKRLIDRDQTALSELYQQFGVLVYSIALRVMQNPGMAEEVTQDVFLKIWHQPGSWDPERGKFVSWLLTISRYTAIDRLRKEQRRPLNSAFDLDNVRLGKPGAVDDPVLQDGKLLRALLTQLPEEQTQVIELAFFQGLTHSELAEYLHLPLGTVKTRIRLGLQKLKTLWNESIEH